MESRINELIGKSLSNDEILKSLENKANLISYTDAHKYKTLDSLLGRYGACVILYETKKLYGHWCCIFKLNNKCVEFFDPYGIMPDSELKFINKEYQKESRQDFPYLTKLMIDSPYILSYNHHRFQEYKKGVNSCGRWVVCRLLFRFLDLDRFIAIFGKKRKYTSDFYATLLTRNI